MTKPGSCFLNILSNMAVLRWREEAGIQCRLHEAVQQHPAKQEVGATPAATEDGVGAMLQQLGRGGDIPDRVAGRQPADDLHMEAGQGEQGEGQLDEGEAPQQARLQAEPAVRGALPLPGTQPMQRRRDRDQQRRRREDEQRRVRQGPVF